MNTYGGLDFSIYRMGAMTIFDNEGFDKELYGRAMVSIGVLDLPFAERLYSSSGIYPDESLSFWGDICLR